jgi:hypothetical protein
MKASVKTLTPEQRATLQANGICPLQFRRRIAAGWPLNAAINTVPGDYAKRYCVNGQRASLRQHCADAGLNYWTVYSRLYLYGMTLEEALSKPVKRPSQTLTGRQSLVNQFLMGARV